MRKSYQDNIYTVCSQMILTDATKFVLADRQHIWRWFFQYVIGFFYIGDVMPEAIGEVTKH